MNRREKRKTRLLMIGAQVLLLTVVRMSYFNGVHETVQDILKHYDDLGGPTTYGHDR